MNDDQNRQMARNAMAVQNLQLKLIGGMVLGFIVGVLIGAYVFFPMGGWGSLLGILAPIIGIFVGQRAVLSMLGR